MHKAEIIPAIIFLAFISFSCQEDFNPKTKISDKYVVSCIITLDYEFYQSGIEARVSRIFDTNGFDSSQDTVNHLIHGADIHVEYRGSNYILKEDSSYRVKYFYYKYGLRFYPSQTVYLYAKMPDGTVLTGQTLLPKGLQLDYSFKFRHGFNPNLNRFLLGEAFKVYWGNQENHLFFPKLYLNYSVYCKPEPVHGDEGPPTPPPNFKRYTIEIPTTFMNKNGHNEPVFVNYTYDGSISYNYSAIDSMVARISQGNPNKKNYRLDGFTFSFAELDEPLSKYYASTKGGLDQYSISLDESVYSNIKGGIGIFGSTRKYREGLGVDTAYARSFGYRCPGESFPDSL